MVKSLKTNLTTGVVKESFLVTFSKTDIPFSVAVLAVLLREWLKKKSRTRARLKIPTEAIISLPVVSAAAAATCDWKCNDAERGELAK